MPPQDLRAALRRVLSDSVRQYPKGSHRSTGEGTLPSCSSPSRMRVGIIALTVTISAAATLVLPYRSVGASGATYRVPLETWFRLSDSGGLPTIDVQLGNDRPVRLLLDTASVGIRVLHDDVAIGTKSSIVVGTTSDNVTFTDGVHLTGVVARTSVKLGSVEIPNVPFQYVTSISCTTSGGCPAFTGSGPEQIDGIFGTSISPPQRSDPLINPLMELPSAYQGRWRINYGASLQGASTGALILGAPIPNHAAAVIKLRPSGRQRATGLRYWNDLPYLCWSFSSSTRYCGPSRFDSGSDEMYVQSNPLPTILGVTSTLLPTQVRSGIEVSLFTPRPRSRSFWSYTTGDTPDFDSTEALVASPSFFDSGVQAFYDLNFIYNVASGQIVVINFS